MTPTESPRIRPIRSYVLRQGRITQAQQDALDKLWPQFGVDETRNFDAGTLFPRPAPLIVEIGFGNGESLVQMAAAMPEKNFLGIEVHRPGVGHLLLRVQDLGLTNVRVCCADAVEVLSTRIADGELAGIQIFFPDPWHKKRHHKRRLINNAFVELAGRKLAPGGTFHAATDWEHYATHVLEALESCGSLQNAAGPGHFSERPSYRPQTKFEARGQRLGHGVWDLIFVKRG
ncbi:MAG: trmB [Proteobacteria bacterium]|nr:trmB [Pseudomonadota bacterium]